MGLRSLLPTLLALLLALESLPLSFSFASSQQYRAVTQTSPGSAVPFHQRQNDFFPLKMSLSSDSNDEDDAIPSSPLDRPVLAMIDTAALLVFAAVGKASHSADGSLDIAAVFMTALPFLFSWFVTSPVLGCYTPSATSDLKQAATTTAKGWAVAVPLGCALRGIVKGYVPPVPFIIVTLISTLIILTSGRAAYTALAEVYVELF